MPISYLPCSKCDTIKPLNEFHRKKNGSFGRQGWCKSCLNSYNRGQLKNPKYRMWLSSHTNSRAKGLEHTISQKDIPLPRTCKYLGIVLDYRRAAERGRLRSFNAPSIDRIDPTRGYVPGNIQVISDLANRMKQDATVEQLLAFAEGVIQVHGGG